MPVDGYIYVKNIPAKYHPDLIWNDRALGFLQNCIMAAILKLWHRIRNLTLSIDADLIEDKNNNCSLLWHS